MNKTFNERKNYNFESKKIEAYTWSTYPQHPKYGSHSAKQYSNIRIQKLTFAESTYPIRSKRRWNPYGGALGWSFLFPTFVKLISRFKTTEPSAHQSSSKAYSTWYKSYRMFLPPSTMRSEQRFQRIRSVILLAIGVYHSQVYNKRSKRILCVHRPLRNDYTYMLSAREDIFNFMATNCQKYSASSATSPATPSSTGERDACIAHDSAHLQQLVGDRMSISLSSSMSSILSSLICDRVSTLLDDVCCLLSFEADAYLICGRTYGRHLYLLR